LIDEALTAIRAGEVVGLPTDTVYGIGVDPLDDDAVRKLFELKGRPENRPLGLLVASVAQASEIGEIQGEAAELGRRHWPGALTLVVTPRVILSDWVGDSQRRTVGIRVPDHAVALELLERAGPLAVTSANHSGEPEVLDDIAARRIFGSGVAYYLPGKSPGGTASTVVDATTIPPVVLRQGPVSI
jgi:tRNA threonylcarbamoyl adenosine modification protein (Sua5/YciO/YrdC/YwlC family)